MRKAAVLIALICLVAVTALVGCAGGEEAAAGLSEDLTWLRSAKQTLDGKRVELAQLRQELMEMPAAEFEEIDAAEAEAEAEAEAAVEGEAAVEAEALPPLEERISTLENEVADLSEEFGGRLVGYINSLEIIQGEALTPEQEEAIRMKSDEDLEVALEWIEKGGDYRRAIEIYDMQLQWDPGYARLEEARARAEEMRYVTRERFELLEKGMNQQQVRALLGPVNLHNVREYPEKKTVAWFYLKDPELVSEGETGAAGIYFNYDNRSGFYTVYQLDYEVATE